jgi:hypothetical protein
LVRAGETMLLPDSLQSGNSAGFFWDYSPPQGTDTLRIFASTDLQTAQMIRNRVRALGGPAAQPGPVATRAVSAAVGDLRRDLSRLATRGLVTVPDATSHVPGSAVPMNPGSAVPAPAAPAADWVAATITVVVGE